MQLYKTIEPYFAPVISENDTGETEIFEMTYEQTGFLCGLIKKFKPKKLVEVGVSSGGTTSNIMNCLDILGLDTQMYSIDLNERLYRDTSRETGYYAKDIIREKKIFYHRFLLGHYLPEVLEDIGYGIDFIILDTVHHLPGELLDFLAVFPFLTSDATVVLHDIALSHDNSRGDRYIFATQVLFETVFADKYLNNDDKYPNIGAFRINENTKDSIPDVFSSLTLTWRYLLPDKEKDIYREWYNMHYPDILIKLFDQAVDLNEKTIGGVDVSVKEYLESIVMSLLKGFSHILLYGRGHRGKVFKNELLSFGEIAKKVEFVVTSDEEAKKNNCLCINSIPYESNDVIIILTADSEELRQRLSEHLKYHWLNVPENIWFELMRVYCS